MKLSPEQIILKGYELLLIEYNYELKEWQLMYCDKDNKILLETNKNKSFLMNKARLIKSGLVKIEFKKFRSV